MERVEELNRERSKHPGENDFWQREQRAWLVCSRNSKVNVVGWNVEWDMKREWRKGADSTETLA